LPINAVLERMPYQLYGLVTTVFSECAYRWWAMVTLKQSVREGGKAP